MPIDVARHGELIPGYRLLERLGEGGFGEVWKAEAPGGLLKAVKIIHGCLQSDGAEPIRLRQELRALNRVRTVRHPFILSLERFEIVEGRLVIVMELADRSLWDRFKECREQGLPGIPRDELLRYVEEAAEALDVMNVQYDLQHLDIKPQNLFLLFNHVKVGDFGLVKDLEGTSARATSGVTAVYAPPETFGGIVSRFSDQYNLAVAYQELLTGRLPFEGANSRQLMMQHVMGEPDLRPLPPGDRPAVARALAKRPEDRHPSCTAFVQALRQASAANGAHAVPPAPGGPGPDDPVRQTPQTQLVVPHPRSGGGVIAEPEHDTPAEAAAPAAPTEGSGERPVTPARPTPSGTVRAAPAPRTPAERPETTGPGVLFPALVIGLGGLGRQVLGQLHKALRKRGPAETWPHLRLLHLDTDPEATGRPVPGEADATLAPEEVLPTRFHRPAHYLKRQKERGELEQWLPLPALMRMARDQVTTGGWRALGRLAFVSGHNAIAARLRAELEACTAPEALAAADRQTGLGLRTTRPRVYVVTSLTGGTGSGMFLDVAYAVRRALRQLGYPRAQVVGLLLVPGPERGPEAARAVANAFAALTELRHFTAPDAVFSSNCQDAGNMPAGQPPFGRCVLLQLPALADGPAAVRELAAQAGDFLCRDLTTSLGRVADEGRAALALLPVRLPCQTFGTYSFTVPRRPLLQRVAQSLCHRLVRSWQVTDPGVLNQAIESWVAEQLTRWELTADPLARQLQEAGAPTLGEAPAAFCESTVGRWAKGGPEYLGRRPASAAAEAFDELERLVGWVRRGGPEAPGELVRALQEAARTVAEEAEKRLAEVALGALVEPRFRLIGAEEAVQRQVHAALGRAARAQAQRRQECEHRANEIRGRMPAVFETLAGGSFLRWGRRARAADKLVELFGDYLAVGLEGLVAQEVGQVYQTLQAKLHGYLLAVNCCHERMGQFLDSLGAVADEEGVPTDLGLGRYLLPAGSRTMGEAVRCVLGSLQPGEEETLQEKVQALIGDALRSHVHLCTAAPAHFKGLKDAIDREVAAVAETSLGRAHAAELYVEQHAQDGEVSADLAQAFDQAQPELAPPPRGRREELCVLAVPPGPEGEQFRAMVSRALPDTPLVPAPTTDDIVFYREQPHLTLADLPQLGPAAREVYQQVLASDQPSPHSRFDIVEWLPDGGANG
jgi:hypothetical protein